MSDQPINLVLEHLKALRVALGSVQDDVREIKHRQSDMARSLAGLRREQAGDAETIAHVESRMDRFGERLERIETRLDLRDA